jgi:hypothetical protein
MAGHGISTHMPVFLEVTPSRIANKLRGECTYHTPIRVRGVFEF